MRSLAGAVSIVLAVALSGCSESSSDGNGAGTSGSGGSAGAGGSSGSSGSAGSAGGTPRSFALGFTPFPYDVSQAAVDEVFEKLASDGDLYAFHTTEGVPWVEAHANEPFSGYGTSLQTKWNEYRSERDAHPGHATYLALTPLDDSRSKLADYWGDQEHMPPPGPWASYALDAPEVKSAYLAFCRTAIDFFEPDYLAIGIEVNLLQMNAPASWPAYVSLHKATYEALKQDHPDLPIFVTLTAVDLLQGWTSADHGAQLTALAEILPYSDYLGLSFYPFMSAYLTEPIPASTFDDLAALAGAKPIAIGESGYPAQETALPSFGLVFAGTPQKQQGWIERLLGEAEARQMPMVVQFVVRDYDALWQAIGASDADAVWRDTGMYDEAGAARPALDTWKAELARPRAP